MQYDALCFVAIRFDAITTIEKYTVIVFVDKNF